MKLLPSSTPTRSPLNDDERALLERLIAAEREIADLRYQAARLAEAVRWAALSSRGLGLNDVADMLESLIRA